jgi:hypothetical protein
MSAILVFIVIQASGTSAASAGVASHTATIETRQHRSTSGRLMMEFSLT